MEQTTQSNTERWESFSLVYRYGKNSSIKRWFFILMAILILFLFLPWTQNIRGIGNVTTLKLEQRPQEINTVIPGKVLKWYVKEGDYVKAGDTLLKLEEIKVEYLDPQLLNRTKEQLTAKEQSVDFYKDKVGAAGTQITALEQALQLKLEQLQNKLVQLDLKINSEENELSAAENEYKISGKQFERQKALYDSGLVSLTQLEQRNQVYQNAIAKKISVQNKLANTRQDISNTKIEVNAVQQEYNEKMAKARGDQFQSLSEITNGQGEVAKLQNQFSSYSIRNGMYIITAPQSGQITQASIAGIGEIVKEGERLLQIVPDKVQYAVEIYVKPVDLPLIHLDQKVRFLFDGYPAIVFSGWPKGSFGTFGGVVYAIESAVATNGKFRILVVEDKNDIPWPSQLSMGTGANAIALIKDVPIWYELWRNINGFPPDYYIPQKEVQKLPY